MSSTLSILQAVLQAAFCIYCSEELKAYRKLRRKQASAVAKKYTLWYADVDLQVTIQFFLKL